MNKPLLRVAVTGGAGQIAYSLLFRIATGEMLGFDQPIALHILELPQMIHSLEGVKMELEDCAFPLLKEIVIGSDPHQVFEGVHVALLVGSQPRGPGMERSELLTINGKIFIGQGQALNAVADRNVKVLVVGNPCNTNALIAMTNAPEIPRENFFAMTRLDQNRAMAQLAHRAHVPVDQVTHMTIWGNHSSTQVPDPYHAKINGQLVPSVIKDEAWFRDTLFPTVRKRGAAIIDARGKSSAASAASAAIDSIKSLLRPTPEGQWYSVGLCSDGNPYGIAENLIFSFPCRTRADGKVEIVKGLTLNEFIAGEVRKSEAELLEERDLAMAAKVKN